MRLATPPVFAAAVALCTAPLAHDGHGPSDSTIGFAFPIPPPGSYRLPVIKAAAGGDVLDEDGRQRDLLCDVFRGTVTVFALIYTRCVDLCPLATADMARLQDLAAKDTHLSHRMKLVTLSFDPEHDTPDVMRTFAASWRSSNPAAPAWTFLTTPGRSTLEPIVAAYNQRIDSKSSANGKALNHIFRAFLIDPEGRIRNIYSLDFFEPVLVVNDARTLLLEQDGPRREAEGAHCR